MHVSIFMYTDLHVSIIIHNFPCLWRYAVCRYAAQSAVCFLGTSQFENMPSITNGSKDIRIVTIDVTFSIWPKKFVCHLLNTNAATNIRTPPFLVVCRYLYKWRAPSSSSTFHVCPAGLKALRSQLWLRKIDARSCVEFSSYRTNSTQLFASISRSHVWLRKAPEPVGQIVDCYTTGWSPSVLYRHLFRTIPALKSWTTWIF